jgi:hypothetical protein
MPGGVCWLSGVSSSVSMATNLGGVELWGLSGVHVMMDARRTVALSSAVVASIGPGKVNALIPPKDGSAVAATYRACATVRVHDCWTVLFSRLAIRRCVRPPV